MLERGEKLSPLRRGTLPLGIMRVIPQCSVRIEAFSPGSWLICYTDGVLEQRNPNDEEFGEERLIRAAERSCCGSAQACGSQLLAEVRAFGGVREPDDDLTIAIVQFPCAA